MQVFGKLLERTEKELRDIVAACDGLAVSRAAGARSTTPFPNSTDAASPNSTRVEGD